jgi:hypothetical protein
LLGWSSGTKYWVLSSLNLFELRQTQFVTFLILTFPSVCFYWVEWKVFAFFKWKVDHFLQNIFTVFTIFNQLYNFHCLLLPSPSVSQAFQFRPCKNFLVCLRHLFENAKTFRLTQYILIFSQNYVFALANWYSGINTDISCLIFWVISIFPGSAACNEYFLWHRFFTLLWILVIMDFHYISFSLSKSVFVMKH